MSDTTPARLWLGCLLTHPSWYAGVADVFDAKAFPDAADKKVLEVFATLHAQGRVATPADALGALESVEGGGEAVGKLVELMSLCEFETPASFARRTEAHLKTVVKSKTKRGLQIALGAIDEGTDYDWPETIANLATKLRQLDRRKTHFTPLTFQRFLAVASNQRRKVIIPSGFPGIDAMSLGFIVGTMTLICARTNVGKSSYLAALALNQFFAAAALHPDRLADRLRLKMQGGGCDNADPYEARLIAAHAQTTGKERAPYVLILSVEDDLDDYVGRFICNLCDIQGRDFLEDPEKAVYEGGGREGSGKKRIEHIARVFTEDQRLTIADYENDEGDDEKTLAALEKTILGWIQVVTALSLERGEELPPMLVLLDYFQKVEHPEEEGKATPEVVQLRKISSRLKKLAKKQRFALVTAVMLLRGADWYAPDHNDARGGSDVVQDADTVYTLWPFGPNERPALDEYLPKEGGEEVDNVLQLPTVAVESDSFADALEESSGENDGEYFDVKGGASDTSDAVEIYDVPTMRRVKREVLVSCDKGRGHETGWAKPLEFDRAHKRFTSAYFPDKIYRRDPSVRSILADFRKRQGERKR